jgi:hypothetical protein
MAGRVPFEEFNPQDGDIECYLERLEQYFIANDIKNESENEPKRKAILLSSVGSETYRTLKDLCFLQKPSEKNFKSLSDELKGHFKPKRLLVAGRFQFHSEKQQPVQSVLDFATHLKKMAASCKFVGDQIKESLRDRFICGLASENIQKKLLARNFSFQKAVDIALAEEAAAKDVRDMTATSNTAENPVNRVQYPNGGHRGATTRPMKYPGNPQNKFQGTTRTRCDRCGRNNHDRERCFHKNSQCYKCMNWGHLQTVCRSIPCTNSGNYKRDNLPNRAHYVMPNNDEHCEQIFVNSDDGADEQMAMFTIGEINDDGVNYSVASSIKIPVDISGVSITMELDTGAAVSIVSHQDYVKWFKHIPLQPVSRVLHAYTGTPLKIAGEIIVDVTHGGHTARLPLVVSSCYQICTPIIRAVLDERD